jgi:biotin carboxyl carrier protein
LASRIRFEFLPWFEAPTSGLRAWVWNYYQPLYYTAYERWMREAFVVARRLVVEEGVLVQAGQALLVVESMKMEITVHAPADGRIHKLLCSAGQAVSAGQALVLLH